MLSHQFILLCFVAYFLHQLYSICVSHLGALSTLQSWSALSGGTDTTSNKIRREDCNELWLSAVSLGGSKTLLEILSIIDKSHTSSRGNFRTYLMNAVEILMEQLVPISAFMMRRGMNLSSINNIFRLKM